MGNEKLARVVGNILHNNSNPDKYPCFKVVNSKGLVAKNFAYGGLEGQKKRLVQNGVEVLNYKIDLSKYQY